MVGEDSKFGFVYVYLVGSEADCLNVFEWIVF